MVNSGGAKTLGNISKEISHVVGNAVINLHKCQKTLKM